MASLSDRLKNLLRWCKVTRDGGADADQFPVQQVGYLEKVGDALMWFPFGYHANIPAETLAVMLSMQGNSEARVALPGSPVERPAIVAGEVVVYHPATGSKIHFKANGDLEITGAALASLSADSVEVTKGATLRLMDERTIALFNSHTHDSGDPPDQSLVAGTHTTTKLKGD